MRSTRSERASSRWRAAGPQLAGRARGGRHRDAVFGVKPGCDSGRADARAQGGRLLAAQLRARAWAITSPRPCCSIRRPAALSALVSANYLTGVRTGAASAIATKYLSRPDERGAGHRRRRARRRSISCVRRWRCVRSARLTPGIPRADKLAASGAHRAGAGPRVRGRDRIAEPWCPDADVLVTVTPVDSRRW